MDFLADYASSIPVIGSARAALYVSEPKRHSGQMTTRLDVPLLRHQLDRLLLVLEECCGATIEFDADLYWLLETSEMFCLDSVPAVRAGQLSDDIDELTAMASRPDKFLVPWHDLKHLIGLLEALAHGDLP